MISEAYVIATCDECRVDSDEIELTSVTPRGAYDMRNVANVLRGWGWVQRDGRDLCEDCAREDEDE